MGRNPQIRSLLASVSKRAKRLERVGRSKLCKRIHTHRCSQKTVFKWKAIIAIMSSTLMSSLLIFYLRKNRIPSLGVMWTVKIRVPSRVPIQFCCSTDTGTVKKANDKSCMSTMQLLPKNKTRLSLRHRQRVYCLSNNLPKAAVRTGQFGITSV